MGCKILLIDDSEDDQFLFKRILRKSGVEAEVVASTDARKGLELLHEQSFDCIFLDYNLPQMDGIDFLREMKHEQLEVPVIMLTGQEDEKVIIKLMQEGAVDYISKHYLNEEILRLSVQNARNLFEARIQKQEAEKALKISEARLAEAQTIAQVGNWEYNFDTHRLFLSEEARRILDYHPAKNEAMNFHFLRCIEATDIFKVAQAMRNNKNQDRHDLTFRIYIGNTMKYVHAKGYVIKDDEKGIHMTKGTIQDVTVLKEALKAIQKARIGRKATTIVFGIAIIIFLISEALLDPFVDGLHTSLIIGLSFKGGLALFLKPIESFLEKVMLSKVVVA
jgi:DNA-binding response OmpR family regulator